MPAGNVEQPQKTEKNIGAQTYTHTIYEIVQT